VEGGGKKKGNGVGRCAAEKDWGNYSSKDPGIESAE